MLFSIIIPVYNDFESLKGLLPLLQDQTLSDNQYETIIVDNCSDENIYDYFKDNSEITILKECEFLNSPYSCRNRGIEIAKGEIIVLLDSTCYPEKNWLEEASNCFQNSEIDLVAGNVLFRFESKQPTAGELFDSITNIKMKAAVEERQVAKTANLFVRRNLFDEVGLFEEGLRSGGDVAWTKKSTDLGYNLVFCEKAIVRKEARKLVELLKKQFRVGKGQPKLWKQQGKQKSAIKTFVSIFKPINYRNFKKNHSSVSQNANVPLFHLYLVASIVRVIMRVANTMMVLR